MADEYFAVTDQVDALYAHADPLPADAIGPKMALLRREHHRLLGNGHCTRPTELDCAYEAICENCSFFQTSIEFRPTLQAQHDDAQIKGQQHRADLFERLLDGLTEGEASWPSTPRITCIMPMSGHRLASSPCTQSTGQGVHMTRVDGLHRDLFPGADDAVYMDSAAVGLISSRVAEAMRTHALGHVMRGIADAPRRAPEIAGAREGLAQLVGGAAERVVFTQNTSTGLALVTNGLDWSPGDNVVVPGGEFPSNFYPWTQLRRIGVDVREVPMRDGHAPLSAVADAVDVSTRVLTISAVQYSSGHRNDLAALAEIASAARALFVVDGTQAVGALTVDVDRLGVDVLAVSAHKWMLGPLGIGFVHLSERAMRELHPSTLGWMSVEDPFAFDHEPQLPDDGRRFESGTENMAGIVGLRQAVQQVLEVGRDTVEAHVLDRTAEIETMLAELGWASRRSADRTRWSGILIASSGQDDRAIHARLTDAGVRCSLRGGGIRFAPHYFNSSDDTDAVREVLS